MMLGFQKVCGRFSGNRESLRKKECAGEKLCKGGKTNQKPIAITEALKK